MIDVSWLLGLVIPGGVGLLILLVGVLGLIFCTREKEYGMVAGSRLIARIVTGVGVLVLTIAGVVALPWSMQYHTYVPKAGTVQSVHSSFSSDDNGGTYQNFVITIGGQHYLGDDNRFSGVKPGDYVRMLCERDFSFNSPNESWSCNWGANLGRFR